LMGVDRRGCTNGSKATSGKSLIRRSGSTSAEYPLRCRCRRRPGRPMA
jgi:hypothetical protein